MTRSSFCDVFRGDEADLCNHKGGWSTFWNYSLSHNVETLSRNGEILSRNYETASHKNRPFKNAERHTRHCPSPFKDAQTDIIASKTSQAMDRIIETRRLDVLTTGHRHDTKGSENEVEWGDDDHSGSCPPRLANYVCIV